MLPVPNANVLAVVLVEVNVVQVNVYELRVIVPAVKVYAAVFKVEFNIIAPAVRVYELLVVIGKLIFNVPVV
jgi:hypothetical protein